MCGRFALTADAETIQAAFNLESVTAELAPRYNIAPTQPVAVITNENPKVLDLYRWGLIPSWAKDPKIGNQMINARSETIEEKPAFRSAFKRRRCLIPADGFFEWQKKGSDKVPLFIHLKDRELFAMAGLWEVWHTPQGSEVRTCTILTTEPNEFMRSIHNRMPVILRPEDYPLWLSPGEESPQALKAVLKPYDPTQLEAYAVSKMVNRPLNDSPEVIAPVQ